MRGLARPPGENEDGGGIFIGFWDEAVRHRQSYNDVDIDDFDALFSGNVLDAMSNVVGVGNGTEETIDYIACRVVLVLDGEELGGRSLGGGAPTRPLMLEMRKGPASLESEDECSRSRSLASAILNGRARWCAVSV